ncbi:MAG: hypothetical protein ACI9ZB_001582 [Moraxellaceae bacterium]|jgi:hypothetical protein
MSIRNISSENILQSYSFLAFIFLFPMSFIYHSVIGIIGFPAFLGGYFSFASVVLVSIYFIVTFFITKKIPSNHIFFYLLMISWLVFISLQYVVSLERFNMDLYKWGLTGILANVICFVIASNADFDGTYIKKSLKFFLILFFIIIVTNINNGQFYLKLESGNDSLVTYQGFGLYALVTSLVLYVQTKNFRDKIFLFALSFIILYLNGARSEFIFYVVSILLITIIEIKPSFKIIKNLILFMFSIILASKFIEIPKDIMDNRTFQIIDITKSSSYIARDELNDLAVSTIINNPLIGSYGYYLNIFGTGGYAHNILSAWADFGFFIFLLIITTSLYMFLFSLLKIYVIKSLKNNIRLLLIFSTSLLLGYFFAKDYSYMLFGFTVGLYINCLNYGYKRV